MDFLEKNLEQIILETDNGLLQDRGLLIRGKKKSQVSIGNYGIADIITVSRDVIDEELIFNVYELKKDLVDHATFLQAIGYCRGIHSYLKKRGIRNYRINVTLIGKKCLTSNFIYLPDIISNPYFRISIYEYSYDFDGISFKEISGYKMIEEGF
jgi:hypothetical protein